MKNAVKINRAKYRQLIKNGELLEAVYRVQKAGSKKDCCLEGCIIGGTILPMDRYARVFYEDSNEVEVFHYACFQKEFTDDGRF